MMRMMPFKWNVTIAVAMSILILPALFKARAQIITASNAAPAFSAGYRFAENSGEELFANVCQGCHMSDAQGAIGAAAYPPLAANRTLQDSAYPLDIVVNGRRGMPAFGAMMSDDQVAAVVNYLRTHFDNFYQDPVTATDARRVRR
jgi:mono/diheme cytochrome c family protein